ncbi:hypothetical protein [Phyllobacterium pellucidum]|uniref:hypothetical protein n=1 Tax=Phyllobacterium pellucidum TaxID=2740464 RepID=UPI001D15DF22|nr:hypothetical protein [Phyllobacterium sp. T1018]UGY08646.1 hypothetical protein LLE51_011415 [Phyllobacterium sp. T1018]
MNWGKGFFRAWIAISLLWILFVGWVFFSPTNNPAPYLPTDNLLLLEGQTTYKHVDDGPWLTYSDKLELTGDLKGTDQHWSANVYVPREETPQQRAAHQQRVGDLKNAQYEVLVNVRHRIRVREALKVALYVPVPLLIIGLTIGWVASGFRRRKA